MKAEANKKARTVLKAGTSGDVTTAASITWLREPVALRRLQVLGFSTPMDTATFHAWRESILPGVPQRDQGQAAAGNVDSNRHCA
jgi:hypothetical protein